MPFLSDIVEKQEVLQQRMEEIRKILQVTTFPRSGEPGVTSGIRMRLSVRDRLIRVRKRHGMASLREVVYKAMILGLVTLERAQPLVDPGNGKIR